MKAASLLNLLELSVCYGAKTSILQQEFSKYHHSDSYLCWFLKDCNLTIFSFTKM